MARFRSIVPCLSASLAIGAVAVLSIGSCSGAARPLSPPPSPAADAIAELDREDGSTEDRTSTQDAPVLQYAGTVPLNAPSTPTTPSLLPAQAPCFRSRRCLGAGHTVPGLRLCMRGESDGAGGEKITAESVRFVVDAEISGPTPPKPLRLACNVRVEQRGTLTLETDLCIGREGGRFHVGTSGGLGVVAACSPGAISEGSYTLQMGGLVASFDIPDVLPAGGRCIQYAHTMAAWGSCPEDRDYRDVLRRMRP